MPGSCGISGNKRGQGQRRGTRPVLIVLLSVLCPERKTQQPFASLWQHLERNKGGVGRVAGSAQQASCASVALADLTHNLAQSPWALASQTNCEQPFPAVLWDLKGPSFPAKPFWGFEKEVETERGNRKHLKL